MLLDLCFCMRLRDERARFNQILLQLCFCMTRHDEKGRRFNPMLWALYFRIL